jgi:hypothetical protein
VIGQMVIFQLIHFGTSLYFETVTQFSLRATTSLTHVGRRLGKIA